MFGVRDVEYRIAVESRLDKIEEMLRLALFEIKPGEDDVEKYTIKKLENAGCEKVPISYMCLEEERIMLSDYGKKDIALALLYATAIGFANGVKWHEKIFQKSLD